MSNSKTQVLVTGGAGFIGSHLVGALVESGHRVRVLDNLSTGFLSNLASVEGRIEFVQGSILDEATVNLAAQGCSCVFHLAAAISVQQSIDEPLPVHETNALGTLMVLESARRAGARVVFSSSAAVYGEDPELPKNEGMSTIPISPYGIQKLMGEHYLRAYSLLHGLAGFSLRYFNVFGPRQNPKSHYSGVITLFANLALAGEPLTIFGDGSQTRDFVYVADVVRANLLAMKAPEARGQALNVGTGVETGLTRLAETIVDASGREANIQYVAARPGDILRSVCDPDAATAALGFVAQTHLERDLSTTVRSFR